MSPNRVLGHLVGAAPVSSLIGGAFLFPALAALLLSACATTGPSVATPEVEAFEKILRARSARFFVDQNLRLHTVGVRLLKALPEQDQGERAPYLGLLVGEATEALADAFGVPKRDGVFVLGVVPGGPADRSWIQAGDYLEEIGPLTLTAPEDLAALADSEAERPTPVLVRRGEMLLKTWIEVERLPRNVAFSVVEDDAVDAFATPGAITVTTGMLRFLRSDDELAVVVGHELAHLTRRHTLGRVGLALPSVVLGVLAGVVVPGSQRLVANIVEKAVANIIRGALTRIDRDMEREADIFGLLYAYAADYDPRAAGVVWERFAVELPRSMTASLFAVHPPSSERLIRIQKMTEAILSSAHASATLGQIAAAELAHPQEPAADSDPVFPINPPLH